MKKLIYGLYVVFAVITATTFYMAHTTFDGLVEPGYYERSKDYFEQKETEEELGLSVSVPDKLVKGRNRFRAEIGTASGPLARAAVELYVGDVKTTRADMRFGFKEASPGVYVSDIAIPYRGMWLLRLEIHHERINTERRWFVKI